ncbi:MAG TPA: glycosyltransferase family 2 protein [Bdellovibrionota bacterium]|jgi:glycosyltransferase involved in cell wall biosynthesis
MSEQDPLLTVVIPTRNRKDWALQAARSVLGKLPFPYELIISDNASDDSTPELAREVPQARYIRRPVLLRMVEHWNLCVAEARGKYIKLLCDDDWILPGALEREVARLECDLSASAVASSRLEMHGPEDAHPKLKSFTSAPRALSGRYLLWNMLLGENVLGPPSAVTFRRKNFPGFPPAYRYASDWAAWIQLADLGEIAFLPDPGCGFRLHPNNLTQGHVESGSDFLEVQALRLACLHRLTGFDKVFGLLCFLWIWVYRFARRVARHFIRLEPRKLLQFIGRVIAYRPPPLPRAKAE